MSSHRDDRAEEPRREASPRPRSGFGRFLTGATAFSVGVFLCGAVGSYSPTDPSLNTAVSGGAGSTAAGQGLSVGTG